MDSARNELLVASSVSEYPMSRNEQIVVDLPEEEDPEQVVGKDQPEHGGEEEEEDGKKESSAGP